MYVDSPEFSLLCAFMYELTIWCLFMKANLCANLNIVLDKRLMLRAFLQMITACMSLYGIKPLSVILLCEWLKKIYVNGTSPDYLLQSALNVKQSNGGICKIHTCIDLTK